LPSKERAEDIRFFSIGIPAAGVRVQQVPLDHVIIRTPRFKALFSESFISFIATAQKAAQLPGF
jgi:hypothetical protein